MKSYSVTIQMKAIEQYFPVVLFVFQYTARVQIYFQRLSIFLPLH